MANVSPRAARTTLSGLDHDISIPIASPSPARAFLAVTCALILLWFLTVMSGCSSTATGEILGSGGSAGSGGEPGAGGPAGTAGSVADGGPILTACPAEVPAAGTACADSLINCTYGQQRCCDHFEPAIAAYCQAGRIVISHWETACVLGFVCPVDGGRSDLADGTAPDAGVCCPPDQVKSGCMNVGGYSANGCFLTCDFFCSTNWRIEADSHGCPTWRYDTRAPAPGEGPSCFPQLDGGGGADANR